MTADPPAQVAAALAPLRAVADEVVVAVDSRVDTGSLAAYAGVADTVLRFDFRPPVDRPRGWLAGRCSGDWLLSIDGDEVPGTALVAALPDLISADDVVQYWLPRRWVHPDSTTWLGEAPWWPDFQLRLLRNDATLAARAEPHGGFVEVLPSRHAETPLYHLDCVVNDAGARAAKAARYEALAPGRAAYGGGGLNDVMYRPERWAPADLHPVPGDDRRLIEAVLAARTAAPAGEHPTELVPSEDVDACASSPSMAEGDYAVGLALFEGSGDACRPLRLAPAEVRPVYFRVENRGGATWRWGLHQQPEVRVSYHWRSAAGAMLTYDGMRSPLPCTLGPGGSAVVPVWVEAPAEPGPYLLEIDLVHEHVRWFESPLPVRVVVADRLPAFATATTEVGEHAC